MHTDTLIPARLHLYQLMSPTLPVGGFTYSQGLERAVEDGWVRNQSDALQWLLSVLHYSQATLEIPTLGHLYTAWQENDYPALDYWTRLLLANRETSELRAEEQQRAAALLTLLRQLPLSQTWPQLHDDKVRTILSTTPLAGFALAAMHWHIPLEELSIALCWNWLENSIAAAVKLVPLGQTAGQQLMQEVSRQIPQALATAQQIAADEIGACTPALAIASSLHETQYCRLFRS